MSNNTRATLLRRLRDGADPLAWDEFFGRYWPLIYASARHRGCSEHTAEEIVQEVMLTIFRQRDIYRYDPARGRFRDWLGTVVRNKIAEQRRRPSNRVRARGGDSDVAPVEPEAEGTQPDAAWEGAFESGLLLVLLDIVRREINPATYLAFELSALAELSTAEVSRITGLSRTAIYKARRRVLRRLEELGETYREDGRLDERLKQALRLRPSAGVERALSTRIENTMRSR